MNTVSEQAIPALPARKQASYSRLGWLVVTGLITLSLIPSVAGMVRLVSLAGGPEITEDNARFVTAPLPVVIHIISVTPYCILGALQFAPGFRAKRPRWHRISGRFLVPFGLAAALSGMWMTVFYSLPPHLQGPLLVGTRLLVGSAMTLSLVLGLAAILRRDIQSHRAWMIRGYALGQGAGTQAFVMLPWMLIFGTLPLLAYELLMIVSWLINVAVAEWIIRRQTRRSGNHTAGYGKSPG